MDATHIRTALAEQGERRAGAYIEWKDETKVLVTRMREARAAKIPMTEIARLAGVSRKTAYQMLRG
jgi:DNA-binding phage protein